VLFSPHRIRHDLRSEEHIPRLTMFRQQPGSPSDSSADVASAAEQERELSQLPVNLQMRSLFTSYSALPLSPENDSLYRTSVVEILSEHIDKASVREVFEGNPQLAQYLPGATDEDLVKQMMLMILQSFPRTSDLFAYAIQMLDQAAEDSEVR